MITAAEASAYLDSALGITVPDVFLNAAVSKVGAVDVSQYSAVDQVMIQCLAVAIVASAGAPRRIASQGSPSGASRSFKNEENALSTLRKSLKALDTAGVMAGVVGPDPRNQAFIMAVV
jgi:hypothetical protein